MSLEKIRKSLRPSIEEEKAALAYFEEIRLFIKEQYGLSSLLVGSVGKGTFVKDDKDLDIFVLFPPETPREILKEKGLKIGKSFFESRNMPYNQAYAEHPYISGIVDGYDIEIVPCYEVDDPQNMLSSVDRTPFHLSYVLEHLKDAQKDEVRLLKRFLKAQKLYGADARTQGFSGYLCELLIIAHDSFENLVANASLWGPQTRIKLADSGAAFKDPLVCIDPVDATRNAASAVSVTTYARFIEACRAYGRTREDSMFYLPKRGYERVKGGRLYVITFNTKVIEDTFYAQCRKFVDTLHKEAERQGFTFYRCGMFKRGFLIDVETATLPHMEKHVGPPVFSAENAARFREHHPHCFVEHTRLVALRERKYQDVTDLIRTLLREKTGMGIHLKKAQTSLYLDTDAEKVLQAHVIYVI